jgi:hypothetical protein
MTRSTWETNSTCDIIAAVMRTGTSPAPGERHG